MREIILNSFNDENYFLHGAQSLNPSKCVEICISLNEFA